MCVLNHFLVVVICFQLFGYVCLCLARFFGLCVPGLFLFDCCGVGLFLCLWSMHVFRRLLYIIYVFLHVCLSLLNCFNYFGCSRLRIITIMGSPGP